MKKIKKFKDDLTKTDAKRRVKKIKSKKKIDISNSEKYKNNFKIYLNEEE